MVVQELGNLSFSYLQSHIPKERRIEERKKEETRWKKKKRKGGWKKGQGRKSAVLETGESFSYSCTSGNTNPLFNLMPLFSFFHIIMLLLLIKY